MHSRIFELTQANLNREDWATENNFVYDEEKNGLFRRATW